MRRGCFGIFVGGRGVRMGGLAKGKLRLPDSSLGERGAARGPTDQQTVIGRLIEECRAVEPRARLMLVGASREYADLGLPEILDDPPGIGPIGGLLALLRDASNNDEEFVIALACDLPFLSRALIRRLVEADSDSFVLAPRQENFWQPLAARYSVRALPVLETTVERGERSFQPLFFELGSRAEALTTTVEELAELRDWDTPDDVNGRNPP